MHTYLKQWHLHDSNRFARSHQPFSQPGLQPTSEAETSNQCYWKDLRNIKKRYYSPKLKEQAVRLSYQREDIKELADELGIEVQRIYKWRKAAKTTTSPKPEKPIPDDTLELKQLRKALKEKELELEILKKAVHIFSKSDGKSMDL